MDRYLDTCKSIIISSPAGSGKTEKLARRYIALLRNGVDIERILAITFTDKAAAEMKERILRILRDEDYEIFKKVIDKMSLMRVSTIHSFCASILRRFSFEAGIDPNYKVEDAIESDIAWEEMLYEVLMNVSGDEEDLFLRLLGERGFRGLQSLKRAMSYLFKKGPFSLEAYTSSTNTMSYSVEELINWPGAKEAIEDYERLLKDNNLEGIRSLEGLFLTDRRELRRRAPKSLSKIVDYQGWAQRMYEFWMRKNNEEYTMRAEGLIGVFKRCFDRYTEMKRRRGFLDFSDLEYIVYKILTEESEWANILYAFDEKTDHILVDEFQDTNDFQWAIIDKLTEEWRSGIGAKRDEGIHPTVFLVGDEKQSIYFFRGANVEVFNKAKERLRDWLGEEFHYEEVKENFRSLPAIIDFTNYVFSKIMRPEKESPAWMTRYSPFVVCREPILNTGRVELILLDGESKNILDAKQKEAGLISKRILSIVGNMEIMDKRTKQQRPCRYEDIAILLRKRTHLKRYEDALRRYNIPFVTVKGIGFYQESEIAMLRALVYFLSNTADDYSLYILLKSPFFMVDEGSIIKLVNYKGESLFTKLKNMDRPPEDLRKALERIEELVSEFSHTPLSELLEHALTSTGAWRYFHEPQRRANIKKFIRLVEDLEANGKSILKIRDFLERTYYRDEEPKANINTEGMNAVRIMTIHAAKGLEFPVVFLPGLEESFILKTEENLIYEKGGQFYFKSIAESYIRRIDEDFNTHLKKEEEEQKRLLYVAVTRAEDALFLISRWEAKDKSFFGFIRDAIGLRKEGDRFIKDADIKGFSILNEEDVNRIYEATPRPKEERKASIIPSIVTLSERPRIKWKSVTEAIDIRSRHGRGWLILGDIFHRLFEEISKGIIRKEEDIKIRAVEMLEKEDLIMEEKNIISLIEDNISILKDRGIWQEVILPKRDSFAELPFIMELDDTVYTGRIDRVIKEDGKYKIYDYKTFPVRKEEIGYLLREYSPQLAIYKKAVQRIFNARNVKSYIIFTHIGEMRELV